MCFIWKLLTLSVDAQVDFPTDSLLTLSPSVGQAGGRCWRQTTGYNKEVAPAVSRPQSPTQTHSGLTVDTAALGESENSPDGELTKQEEPDWRNRMGNIIANIGYSFQEVTIYFGS